MPLVRIIQSNPDITDSDLTAALIAGTSGNLDADEADALVRVVAHHAPTIIEGQQLHGKLLMKIATVLENNGYRVYYDA